MITMDITSARYVKVNGENNIIEAIIDGITMCVPCTTDNTHWRAILDWVADGNTITAA